MKRQLAIFIVAFVMTVGFSGAVAAVDDTNTAVGSNVGTSSANNALNLNINTGNQNNREYKGERGKWRPYGPRPWWRPWWRPKPWWRPWWRPKPWWRPMWRPMWRR